LTLLLSLVFLDAVYAMSGWQCRSVNSTTYKKETSNGWIFCVQWLGRLRIMTLFSRAFVIVWFFTLSDQTIFSPYLKSHLQILSPVLMSKLLVYLALASFQHPDQIWSSAGVFVMSDGKCPMSALQIFLIYFTLLRKSQPFADSPVSISPSSLLICSFEASRHNNSYNYLTMLRLSMKCKFIKTLLTDYWYNAIGLLH